MVAVLEGFEAGPALVAMSAPTDGEVARELADGYLSSISACWRGEPGWMVFERWLWSFWCPELPSAPDRPPDAVSPHGGGGRGIDWYETPTAVVGHVKGAAGGYRVPIGAIPPGARMTDRLRFRDRCVFPEVLR